MMVLRRPGSELDMRAIDDPTVETAIRAQIRDEIGRRTFCVITGHVLRAQEAVAILSDDLLVLNVVSAGGFDAILALSARTAIPPFTIPTWILDPAA